MSVLTLEVDGKMITALEGQTIFSAAWEGGIRIPRLRHLEGLSDPGACRLCLVEIEGQKKLFASCLTEAAEGMVVRVNTPALRAQRKLIVELLFAERNHVCSVCVMNGGCELQDLAAQLGVDHIRLAPQYPCLPVDVSHERFGIDHNRCILCTRCVRVCAAQQQRRLLNYAQVLQSHALSFFHLSAPDLLLGMDSPPEDRNIFGLLKRDPDFVRRGIRLRQFGQRVIELAGGKRIHPAWSGPGGVHRRFTTAQRDEILTWIPEALDSVALALDRLKPILDHSSAEIEQMGAFPSLFLATVAPDGGLEYYDGQIRIVDEDGNTVADRLDPAHYSTFLGEVSEESSFIKSAFYRPRGYPRGCYRVGPLARLNVARFADSERADREMREFKQRPAASKRDGAVCESFYYHLARLIEMLHAVERIEQLMSDPELFGDAVQARAPLHRSEGIGSCEAPRGTLFHHYWVDADGLITRADLLIATSQNSQAMNLAIDQTARHFLKRITPGTQPSEGILNGLEAAIRCYDPCLSCSTHALGQMPLMVEWTAADGTMLGRIARPS